MKSPLKRPAAAVPVVSNLVEAMVARLDQARSLVSSEDFPGRTSVHELRKSLKNVRAGVRLLSDAGGVDLSEANILCRDAGRLISGLRDADVCLVTLDSLPALSAEARNRLAAALSAHRSMVRRSSAPDAAARRRIDTDLAGVQTILRTLDIDAIPPEGLQRAMRLAGELGERRLRKLKKRPEPERFHDLRKAAKRELYQRRYLAAGREDSDTRIGLLDAVGEHLGRYQDLHVLRDVAAESGALDGEVTEVIDAEIAVERAASLELIERAYGDSG